MKEKKLTSEEFKLKWAKGQLEHKKEVYENYLKVLIKYNIPSVAYSAIGFDELYSRELLILMEKARKHDKFLMRMMFGEKMAKPLTEIERLKSQEEDYDKLIKLVENRISEFPFDIKMKIAKDSIEKQNSWFGLFKYENELYKLEKKEV